MTQVPIIFLVLPAVIIFNKDKFFKKVSLKLILTIAANTNTILQII